MVASDETLCLIVIDDCQQNEYNNYRSPMSLRGHGTEPPPKRGGLRHFYPMKVNIYFDGFNFYYGAVKGTPYRWMNLRELCERSLPRDHVHRIRYFTARVDGSRDPDQPRRQDVYLRALRTLKNLTIHEGSFRQRRKRGELVALHNASRKPVDHLAIKELSNVKDATILGMEEKGSDVNLATYLLLDAARKDFEAAFIVSDDSDLVEPIKVVRREFGLRVGIINPYPARDPKTNRKRLRHELRMACTSGMYRHFDRRLFVQCQLPDPIVLNDGTLLRRPRRW